MITDLGRNKESYADSREVLEFSGERMTGTETDPRSSGLIFSSTEEILTLRDRMGKTICMTSIQPLALAYEVERTLYESSSTWEGIDAHEIPLSVGEVVLRTQTGCAAAMPLRFPPAAVEASLAQAIEQIEAIVPWCLWVIGPSSQPPDLQQRFDTLGFRVRMQWDGLALDNLSLDTHLRSPLSTIAMQFDN